MQQSSTKCSKVRNKVESSRSQSGSVYNKGIEPKEPLFMNLTDVVDANGDDHNDHTDHNDYDHNYHGDHDQNVDDCHRLFLRGSPDCHQILLQASDLWPLLVAKFYHGLATLRFSKFSFGAIFLKSSQPCF